MNSQPTIYSDFFRREKICQFLPNLTEVCDEFSEDILGDMFQLQRYLIASGIDAEEIKI